VGSDPALVPDAASPWVDGLTNNTLQAFPKEYVSESGYSLAHLDNSPRGRVRQQESDIRMPPT